MPSYGKCGLAANVLECEDKLFFNQYFMQGYCVKCKEKREFAGGAEEVAFGKKGRRAMKGQCSVCDTGMYKILPGNKK